jgi:NAD-dependent deacetylase sirtuin 2
MFLGNSYPYLEVRRPFILGTQQKKWKATIAHRFAELLHAKTGKLSRIYTQNIDGLDHQCQIPTDKIVNVHGTLAEVACESCGADHDFDEFCQQVRTNIKDIYNVDSKAPAESLPIACKSCGRATVKPKTVLFGSGLPGDFFTKSELDMPSCDMLIIAGTSLVVSPANSLVYRVADEAVRLIINRDEVGQELGIMYGQRGGRDFFMEGDCDEQFLKLIEELGWLGELEEIIDALPQESACLVKKRLEA